MAEISITEIQKEFLNGVLNLYPRVIPGVNSIKSIQIGLILYNFVWMTQWE